MKTQNLEDVKREAGELSVTMAMESNMLMVHDQRGLVYAIDLNNQAKDEIKRIAEKFEVHKSNAWKAHKDLCNSENEALAPFKQITEILKPKILKYQTEQDAIREKERLANEAKQRIDEAVAKQVAEDFKDRAVDALLEAGDLEKAEAVAEATTPEPMAVFVPEVKVEKVAGAGVKKVWKARVLNEAKVPDMFKIVDQKVLDAYAVSTKGKGKIEGVEFYQKTGLSGR